MRSIKQLNSFEEWTFISEHENIVKFEAEPYILIYGFGLKYILACTPIKKHNWNQNDWWLDDRSDCLYKTWLKSVIKLMDILAKHQEYCEWKLILMPLTYTGHRNKFFTYLSMSPKLFQTYPHREEHWELIWHHYFCDWFC